MFSRSPLWQQIRLLWLYPVTLHWQRRCTYIDTLHTFRQLQQQLGFEYISHTIFALLTWLHTHYSAVVPILLFYTIRFALWASLTTLHWTGTLVLSDSQAAVYWIQQVTLCVYTCYSSTAVDTVVYIYIYWEREGAERRGEAREVQQQQRHTGEKQHDRHESLMTISCHKTMRKMFKKKFRHYQCWAMGMSHV